MRNLHVQIFETVTSLLGVHPAECLEQPIRYTHGKRVDLSAENIAFALVCHFFNSKELGDLQMDAYAIAKYFNMEVDDIVRALNRDQFLKEGSRYRIVKIKTQEMITNYLNTLYERAKQG